jgi:hypothetical protein
MEKIRRIVEVVLPICSVTMVLIGFLIPLALIFIGIFIWIYLYNLFSFVKKIDVSKPKVKPVKVIWTFLLMHLFIIFIFSMCYAGITKIEGDRKGLFASNGDRLECSDFEEYFNIFYFSVVTATTLGYGDIHPEGLLARAASLVEVILLPLFAISLFNSISKLSP